jgi:catechol-2,3-dioxygenase
MQRIIRGLGEIALRVNDLESMQAFYSDVVGLALMKRFPHAAFFRIADGFEGHTQILALFDRSAEPEYEGPDPRRTTVDHIAFTISLGNYAAEKTRLERAGHSVRTAVHAWVQWRSLYVDDPEGNTVELVCYDPSISKT